VLATNKINSQCCLDCWVSNSTYW